MAVKIGSARGDEHGHATGGSAGDQKQKSTPDYSGEVSMQDWYKHSKGWVVLRCKDAAKADLIAQDMEYACNNPLIGYDQDDRDTLYSVAKKVGFDCSRVKTKCECDCSALVRVCVNYAGIKVGDFYTGDEAEVLIKTGMFEKLTASKYTTSSSYLRKGDILVTATKGHTVVVLTNGSKVEAPAESYDKNIAGKYQITTDLYLRTAPVTGHEITVMKKDNYVLNYGYYTEVNGVKWLYAQYGSKIGFCSSRYLKKV